MTPDCAHCRVQPAIGGPLWLCPACMAERERELQTFSRPTGITGAAMDGGSCARFTDRAELLSSYRHKVPTGARRANLIAMDL